MRGWAASLVVMLTLAASATWARDLPVQLPEPKSAGEAWNVVEESSRNVDQLMDERLLRDVTFQLANIGTALKSLESTQTKEAIARLLDGAAEIITAIRQRTEPFESTKSRWIVWRKMLAELELHYSSDLPKTGVYICPMHPLDRHTAASEKCSVCGMSLVRRHLPASSVYQKPGEATMELEILGSLLVVGQRADLRVRLARLDGSPVVLDDLVEVHTRKIHLLINDRSLSDYLHEHPEPTDVPGEYRFSFTPTRPGAYRIWADIVPASTGVQEYVIADIPAAAESSSQPIGEKRTVLSTIVDGRTYTLAFQSNELHASQTVLGTVTIADTSGKPFTQLEPIMGAFAHIVGFSDDLKTVVHIHPANAEPKSPQDHGGPAFAFKFYSPTAGFMRLYVQTQIKGVAQFAPFSLTVLPAEQR